MPCYPALALLLGSAMAAGGAWIRGGTRVLTAIAALAAVVCLSLIWMVRGIPAPGDISQALSHNPQAYTLSLGHMLDLTIESFAYLRLPLAVAAVAFLIGAVGTVRSGARAFWAAAIMMLVFFHAARLALVTFDPYLSSRPLAQALIDSPPGEFSRRSSLLHVLLNLLLHQPHGLVAQWPLQQLGLRLLRPGRAQCLPDRPGMEREVAAPRTVLHSGRRFRPAAAGRLSRTRGIGHG